MIKNKLINDDRGFTLVELLVTLLVSSFVVLAASMFLSVGIRTYNSANNEVSLQMESQIALNLLENLIIEADTCIYSPEYEYKAGEGETGTCPLFRIYCRNNDTVTLYLVILDEDDSRLLLKTRTASYTDLNRESAVTGLFDNEMIKTTVMSAIEADRPALLASFVKEFTVTPADIEKNTNDLVRVYVKLERQNKDYEATTNVSMRNGVHR